MIVLKIEGMTCPHCVRNLSNALAAVPGVAQVQVTLDPGRAEVEGEAPLAALLAAVEGAGYQGEPISG